MSQVWSLVPKWMAKYSSHINTQTCMNTSNPPKCRHGMHIECMQNSTIPYRAVRKGESHVCISCKQYTFSHSVAYIVVSPHYPQKYHQLQDSGQFSGSLMTSGVYFGHVTYSTTDNYVCVSILFSVGFWSKVITSNCFPARYIPIRVWNMAIVANWTLK